MIYLPNYMIRYHWCCIPNVYEERSQERAHKSVSFVVLLLSPHAVHTRLLACVRPKEASLSCSYFFSFSFLSFRLFIFFFPAVSLMLLWLLPLFKGTLFLPSSSRWRMPTPLTTKTTATTRRATRPRRPLTRQAMSPRMTPSCRVGWGCEV